jgi:hypothetical protein
VSRSLHQRISGVGAVADVAASSLILATGEASASTCNSPALTGCVKIVNNATNVLSWRLNVTEPNGKRWNRCLIGSIPGGRTGTWSGAWFPRGDRVSVSAHTCPNRDGWSGADAWYGSWSGPDGDQWWTLTAHSEH